MAARHKKIKLTKVRTIYELEAKARTCPYHRYWYLWTVSNLGGPEPTKGFEAARNWLHNAADEIPEDGLTDEANFCRTSVLEELNNGKLQFPLEVIS